MSDLVRDHAANGDGHAVVVQRMCGQRLKDGLDRVERYLNGPARLQAGNNRDPAHDRRRVYAMRAGDDVADDDVEAQRRGRCLVIPSKVDAVGLPDRGGFALRNHFVRLQCDRPVHLHVQMNRQPGCGAGRPRAGHAHAERRCDDARQPHDVRSLADR